MGGGRSVGGSGGGEAGGVRAVVCSGGCEVVGDEGSMDRGRDGWFGGRGGSVRCVWRVGVWRMRRSVGEERVWGGRWG